MVVAVLMLLAISSSSFCVGLIAGLAGMVLT
jgi:hypothetical protein